MSFTHVSPKKPGRVYVRKFDHDEARARYAAGETMAALAASYGVTDKAIWWVVSGKAEAQRQQRAERIRRAGICIDCGAAITLHAERYGRGRCKDCSQRQQATTVRPDELRCSTCKKWKPDADYPFNRNEKWHRGRHTSCRSCLTALRRAYRVANRERERAYDREYRRRRRAIQPTAEEVGKPRRERGF